MMDFNHENSTDARDFSNIENSFYKAAITKFGIWSWDLKRNIIFFPYFYNVNKNKNINEINYDDFQKIVHPDDIEYIKYKISNYINDKNNDYCILEYRVKTKNGDYRWHLNRGLITRYEEGKPIRVRGTFIDITEQKEVQEQLNRETIFLKSMIDSAGIAIIAWEKGGKLIKFNKFAEQISGFKEDEVKNYRWMDTICPKELKEKLPKYLQSLNYIIPKKEIDIICKNGINRILLASNNILYNKYGQAEIFVSMCIDLTNEKIVENKLYESNMEMEALNEQLMVTESELREKYELLQESEKLLKSSKERHEIVILGSNDGIWDSNLVNNEVYYSQKYLDLFGFNDKKFENTDYQWEKLIHPLDYKRVMKCSSDYLNKKIDKYKCEYRMKRKDENYIWVLDSGQAIWDENSKPVRFAGSLTDITEKKERENIIYNMAYFDNLTELPNRAKLNNDLKSIINKARKKNTIFGLMLMDIDDFKAVNDTMGHGTGDKLLKAISKRIKNTLPQNCMIYRLGGDEFVILVDNIDVSYTDNIAKLILECVSKPFIINGMEIFSSVSIGIAVYPDKCDDEHRILENADVAMYKAKTSGKNSYRIYDSYMNLEIINRMKLESDLRRAIKNNEFEVYYQPQNHSKTGKIKGVEALVRWNHPVKGIVSPGEFIPLAEETGLINDMSEFVIRTACKQVKKWNEIIDEPIRVSINLSVRQFQKQNLVETIKSILEETKFSPKKLEFEITESIAMKDFELTMRIIKELKLMGIKISLDDFGTGYSSLNYLQKLEVNTLKIDKTFIDDLAFSSSKKSIVRNIIRLAHELNLKVIAEGVEKEEQLKLLILDKCDEVQGYLFSRPIPAYEFEKLLIK